MMVSNLLGSATLAIALLTAAAPTAGAAEHHNHMMKCAQASADCQVQCDAAFKHCLAQLSEGNKEHAKAAQLLADCAEACKSCATLCARHSPLAALMLECCAKCCDDCAAACEKFPADKQLAACAKTCRDHATQCRELSKHLGK